MKYLLSAILFSFSAITSTAQTHNIFAEGGICFSRINPGLGVTYNYKPLKFLGIGGGVQAYDFFPTITNHHQYLPAVFADLRLTAFPRKRNQLFFFYDLGINFYKHTNTFYAEDAVIYNVPKNNGTYTGIGFGYNRRSTQKGGGYFVAVKTVANGYNTIAYDLVSKEEYESRWGRSSLVLCGGFRFAYGKENFTEKSKKERSKKEKE